MQRHDRRLATYSGNILSASEAAHYRRAIDLRGAPGKHFIHAAFVGYSNGQPDIALLPGCLVKFPTPAKFLTATGDWLVTANAMMAPITGSGKRARKAPQEELGVQTPTATGETAAKTYLEDLDGGKRSCRSRPSEMSSSAQFGGSLRERN